MSVVQAPNPLLEVFADLIAGGATPAEILAFHPTAETTARVSQLIEKLKSDALTPEEDHDLTMFQQAETMLRLVKARLRQSQS